MGQIPEGAKQYQFKKGTSGNPGGRPKRRLVTDAYAKYLASEVPREVRNAMRLEPGATWAECIAVAQIRKASRGSHECARELREAVEGKAMQRIELDTQSEVTFSVHYATPIPGAARLKNLDEAMLNRARPEILEAEFKITQQTENSSASETAAPADSAPNAIAKPTAAPKSESES